jgi:hypothetical protein
MTAATMNRLVAAADALDVDCRPYDDYSGRGMYGRTTCAVVVPSEAVFAALAAVAGRGLPDAEFADFVADLRRLSSDSLGRDTIVY